jgi:hypothetical protein
MHLENMWLIYTENAADENGNDITSHIDPDKREPLLTFDEWLNR